ncbi:MAG: prefoldin subunit [Promethearchaeota archaeon]
MGINLDSLPEELRKKIIDLQNKQVQLQNLRNTHEFLESQNRDTELCIQELEKANPDTTVYKSIGGVLVKSSRDRLLDEKKSLKISTEMRLKSIKQKEERSIQELETIRKSIQADFQKNQ